MNLHTLAFFGTALDATGGNVTLPVVDDPVIRADSNILKLYDNWDVLYSYTAGANLTKARIASGSLRVGGYPHLDPIATAVLPGYPAIVNDLRAKPLTLRAGENVTLQVTNSLAGDTTAILMLGMPGYNFNVNRANLRKIFFTATITSSKGAWSSETNITLEDELAAGDYSIYGMEVWHSSLIAARLVFNNQVLRPGVIGSVAVGNPSHPMNSGGLGLLGTFKANVTPKIQTIHNAATVGVTVSGVLTVGY